MYDLERRIKTCVQVWSNILQSEYSFRCARIIEGIHDDMVSSLECLHSSEQSCAKVFHVPYNTQRYLLSFFAQTKHIWNQPVNMLRTFFTACLSSEHSLVNLMALSAPLCTVYPKKYAHGFCFAVLCCGYTLTDFPISIRLTSLALWKSNDCPSASKATLMNMDKYFMWIHYERLHNHNKAKHNKTVCIILGIYCNSPMSANRKYVGSWQTWCDREEDQPCCFIIITNQN